MKKNLSLGIAIVFLFVGRVVAQGPNLPEASNMSEIAFDDFSSDINAKMGDMQTDLFEILDVDGNKKLSRNEISEFAKGVLLANALSEAEKKSLMNEAIAKFDRFDQDHDNWLNLQEGEAYLNDFQQESIKRQFAKIDMDFSGKLSGNEMQNLMPKQPPSIDEAMKSLEKAAAKIKTMAENPQEMVDNMMKNMAMQQAGEQFYQMDRDKNGEATRKEYAEYMFTSQNEQIKQGEEKVDYRLSQEDFETMFTEMDVAKKGYLSKEEYVHKYTEMTLAPVDLKEMEMMNEEM